MPKLACAVHGENDNLNYAIVDLDAGRLRQLSQMWSRVVAQRDEFADESGDVLYAVEFFDYSTNIAFYSHLPEELTTGEDLLDLRWWPIPEDVDPGESEDVSLLCVAIQPDGVLWNAVPAHGSTESETQQLDVATLRRLLIDTTNHCG